MEEKSNQAWWYMPLVPAFGRQRQDLWSWSQPGLVPNHQCYMLRLCLPKNRRMRKRRRWRRKGRGREGGDFPLFSFRNFTFWLHYVYEHIFLMIQVKKQNFTLLLYQLITKVPFIYFFNQYSITIFLTTNFQMHICASIV